jgi:two-component system OmpR family response regulator
MEAASSGYDHPAPTLDRMRVLVVEDDRPLADILRRALSGEGYAVDIATTGVDAIWRGLENDYDAVVLDVMIPPPDGFDVVRRLRAEQRWMPVLLLTARDAVTDRVAGLDVGADDYLTKPFSMLELLARLRAITRRGPHERPAVLTVGDLSLDLARHQVHRGSVPVRLSPKEFSLLHELMRHPGEPLSRTHLIEHVWDFAYDGTSNVVDVYIRYLRDKIDRPFGRQSVRTVRGAGYCVTDDP